MTRRAASTAVRPPYCECPECGKVGFLKAHATDGTRVYQCHDCVRSGIGLDDAPYTYPLYFDAKGRRYTCTATLT